MTTTLQPLGPNQEKWLKALESGDFKQMQQCLMAGNSYCCLGVGCVVMGLVPQCDGGDWSFAGEREAAPDEFVEFVGLHNKYGYSKGKVFSGLVSLNDNGTTFPEIAAIIRRDPSVYFREPR